MTDNALDRLQFEMERCPYHEILKPEAFGVDPVRCSVTVRLPFRPEFRAAYDSQTFHGGVIAALIDIAGHAAIAVQTGRVSPTIDLRIDYLKPAAGDALLATGRILRLGKAVGRADIEVHDPAGALVAAGRGTFSTV